MGTNRKLIKLSLGLTIPKTAKEFRATRSEGQWIIIWGGNYQQPYRTLREILPR